MPGTDDTLEIEGSEGTAICGLAVNAVATLGLDAAKTLGLEGTAILGLLADTGLFHC